MGAEEAAWGGVFGELWFWAAALLIWARGISRLVGVPKTLLNEALSDVGAARFAQGLARHWLSRTPGLISGPMALPVIGGALAFLAAQGILAGSAWSLAAVTALGPLALARVLLEPRLREAAALGDPQEAAQQFDQLWKAQFAATAGAAALTVVAAIVTNPTPPAGVSAF